jgi:hypothetical protein
VAHVQAEIKTIFIERARLALPAPLLSSNCGPGWRARAISRPYRGRFVTSAASFFRYRHDGVYVNS